MTTESWRLQAVPSEIRRARAVVADFARNAGLDDRTVAAIVLAASEAVTNAVLHAFPAPREPGEVVVRATLAAEALELAIEDDGVGMRQRHDSPGAGYGLVIIEQLSVAVERAERPPPGGTSLRMRFALPSD